MNIVCPNCGQIGDVEEEPAIGQHVICPFCDTKFSYGDASSLGESQSAELEMHRIDVKCPGCGYNVWASKVGQEVECEACGKKFIAGAMGNSSTMDTSLRTDESLDAEKPTSEDGMAMSDTEDSHNNVSESTAKVNYYGNRKYFSRNDHNLANWGCGCSSVVVFAFVVGSAISIEVGLAFMIMGVIVAGLIFVAIYDNWQVIHYPEIDAQAKGMGDGLDDKALNKLGITAEEVSLVEPLRFWGYRFVWPSVLGDDEDNEALWKQGEDGKWRSSEVAHTIFFFGEHSIYCYVRTASLVNGNVSRECTEEYFYKDIVSVKTDSIDVKRGADSVVKVDVFVLVNTGGERLECEVENQAEADEAVKAFRTLLKQKKF